MKKSIAARIHSVEKMSHAALARLDRARACVIATFGPLEVHGPHLPLGQDIMEAYSLAKDTAAALLETRPDWHALLLPPVPVATDALPQLGSVNFPFRLVREVAYYTLRPFAQEGFARLAYSSFHGGPRFFLALESAADALAHEFDAATVSLFSAVLNRVEEGKVFFEALAELPERQITFEQVRQDHHAGFVETSFGLHLWPELVDDGWADLPGCVSTSDQGENRANSSFMYQYAKEAPLLDGLRRVKWTAESIARAVKHFRRETYHGYPGLSSAEEGRRMWIHLVRTAANVAGEFIEQGRAFDGHSPLWKFRHIFLSGVINHVLEDQLGLFGPPAGERRN